jgi:acyl carrier protein
VIAQKETLRSEIHDHILQERKSYPMTKNEFLIEIEKIMNLNPDTLKETDALSSYMQWDSMMKLEFIMMTEEKLGMVVDGSSVGKAQTVNDLLSLVFE